MFQDKIDLYRKAESNVPFSRLFNNFISNWFENNKHLFSQYSEKQFLTDDAERTFGIFKRHWREKGTIPMWYDDNDDTIFADRRVNAQFRAWHDFIHIVSNNDFSLQGEINSYEIQQAFLPKGWEWERALMKAEIVGQGEFYSTNGMDNPIQSQRDFALNYIKSL